MPFFDPARPAYRDNPYPFLARLRAEAPVYWSPGMRAWVLTRYADCAEVLRDGRRFTMDPACTSGPRAEAILAHRAKAPLGAAPTLGSTSGEAHRALRQVVNPLFAPAAVRARREFVAEAARSLVDALPHGAPVEFMSAVANPLPKQIMLALMGIPEDDPADLHTMLSLVQVARSNPLAGQAVTHAAAGAAGELVRYLAAARPGTFAEGTVLGALTHQEMPPADVVSVAAHIATVGSDPASGAIANSVAALASHPAAWDALRREPGQLARAVHELLRFDSPTHIAPRFAAAEAQLGGRKIRRGDSLLAVVGAANRDPHAFERPDELELRRDARRHLGFGQGEHICLGGPLALVIIEAVLEALMSRFGRIALVAAPQWGKNVELRIPDRMLLRFE